MAVRLGARVGAVLELHRSIEDSKGTKPVLNICTSAHETGLDSYFSCVGPRKYMDEAAWVVHTVSSPRFIVEH